MPRNPFTPTFGVTPPFLAGREPELETVAAALDEGLGAPGRATLLTGARGSGKTVLLNALEDLARQRGWTVVSETTRPGIAAELTTGALARLLADRDPDASSWRRTGASGGVAGVRGGTEGEVVDRYPQPELGLREALARLAELSEDDGGGVLLTLDEVHVKARADLRQITQAVQHAFREGRQVAFVGAGLPSSISDVLNDDVMSFLRRAERFELGQVPTSAVSAGLRSPIETAGRRIEEEALARAVRATAGYPFLIQSVGYASWAAEPDAETITVDHVEAGIASARARLGRLVHEPALRDLSPVDRAFLQAMSLDDGPSAMADVARRLGVDANYASQYRLRLLDAEMVFSAGHGRLDFTLPYLREHLRAHASRVGGGAGAATSYPVQGPGDPGVAPDAGAQRER